MSRFGRVGDNRVVSSEDVGDSGALGALLPERVGLFVRLAAKPGMRPVVLDALNRYADKLRSEPATELFVIALDPDDGDVVWLYEWFTSEEGLEAHRSSEPFTELVSEIPDLLETPPGLLRIDPLRLHLRTAMLTENPVDG